ncbi:MAG TPA: hypothetical protein VFB43_02200 [Terracidiphilus sp.]|jgi:predicted anti-sigma-YlaC factor YlaD|nr:hypothetical protein [Terracidiphilus sp.]
MTNKTGKMSCEEFQAQLPELIGSGKNASEHEHIQTCELCRALLADLETIAEAARQLFPVVEPPDNLWEQIESKIKNEGGGSQPKKRVDSGFGMAAQSE